MDEICDTINYGLAIAEVAAAIELGDLERAKAVAISMPNRIKKKKIENAKHTRNSADKNHEARKYTHQDLIELFIRDGFVDRYTGLRLVIPPSLRMISRAIPDAFPYHPNWAEGKCHDSYWDLSATADHLKPVAAGGLDDNKNLVSTSMAVNLQKNSISLESLGWQVYPAGEDERWDGLSRFYVAQCELHPDALKKPYFKQWYRAVSEAIDRNRVTNALQRT